MKTNTKPSHTPGHVGPWSVRKVGDGAFEITNNPLGKSGDSVVARTDHGGQLDCEANARLIAAAPEMLAALKELREAATQAYQSGRVDALAFVTAGNVIAKAEVR